MGEGGETPPLQVVPDADADLFFAVVEEFELARFARVEVDADAEGLAVFAGAMG